MPVHANSVRGDLVQRPSPRVTTGVTKKGGTDESPAGLFYSAFPTPRARCCPPKRASSSISSWMRSDGNVSPKDLRAVSVRRRHLHTARPFDLERIVPCLEPGTSCWSAQGKMRRTRNEHMSAGLPPVTDITQRGWNGRKVPICGQMHRNNQSPV